MQGKTLSWILWLSFLVAGAAEALFFTVFDPTERTFFGEAVTGSRIAAHSIGFFLFWAFAASSSAHLLFPARLGKSQPPRAARRRAFGLVSKAR